MKIVLIFFLLVLVFVAPQNSADTNSGKEENSSVLIIEGHFIENTTTPLVDLDLSVARESHNLALYTGRLEIAELSRDTQRTLIDATIALIMTPSLGLLRVADKMTGRTRIFHLQRQTNSLLLFQATEVAEGDTVRVLTYSFTQQDSSLILFAIEERICSFNTAECKPPLAQYYILRKK